MDISRSSRSIQFALSSLAKRSSNKFSISHLKAMLVAAVLLLGFAPHAQNLDETIRLRIANMNCPFEPTYDASVNYIIERYLANPASLERLIGRGATYFPYFEKALKARNLPIELKYLPIVESGLNASALSHAAAKGLWQFIPETGRRYGLYNAAGVEDRCDPIKASEAAAAYLEKLYNDFGKWDLVLAAYNCGEGRVSNVMLATKSADYQSIKPFLPRETQGYVPAFVAISYLMQHYKDHNLKPQLPDLDMQMTMALKVYKPLSFYQIQQATGLSQDMVAKLNPHILRGQVPASREGTYVYVPRRCANDLATALNAVENTNNGINGSPISVNEKPSEPYLKSSYTVNDGDHIEQLAQVFHVSPHTIMVWNNMSSTYVAKGQELVVYVPTEDYIGEEIIETSSAPGVLAARTKEVTQPDGTTRIVPADDNLPDRKQLALNEAKNAPKPAKPAAKFKYYTVRKGDNLSEIAERNKIDTADLRKANGLGKSSVIRPGQKLKIPLKK